jgi:hypothetical protein
MSTAVHQAWTGATRLQESTHDLPDRVVTATTSTTEMFAKKRHAASRYAAKPGPAARSPRAMGTTPRAPLVRRDLGDQVGGFRVRPAARPPPCLRPAGRLQPTRDAHPQRRSGPAGSAFSRPWHPLDLIGDPAQASPASAPASSPPTRGLLTIQRDVRLTDAPSVPPPGRSHGVAPHR